MNDREDIAKIKASPLPSPAASIGLAYQLKAPIPKRHMPSLPHSTFPEVMHVFKPLNFELVADPVMWKSICIIMPT